MIANFRRRPGATLDEVQDEIKLAFDSLGNVISKQLPRLSIGPDEQLVAHGLGSVPRGWRVIRQGGFGLIYQTRLPDKKFLYLAKQDVISGVGEVGSEFDIFLPGQYYPATPKSNTALVRGGLPGSPANKLWTQCKMFRRAGTVTDIATSVDSGSAAGAWNVVLAIYRPSSSAPLTAPGALVWSNHFNVSGGGLGTLYFHDTPNVTVSAGELLWFAFNWDGVGNGITNSVGTLVISAAQQTILGTDWVVQSTGVVPILTSSPGYKHASTYASVPPDPYPGGSTPTRIVSTDGNIPVVLFKFTETPISTAGGLVVAPTEVDVDLEVF